MKQVHVECKPDELLVSKLGFQKKLVTHHQGKSRVFHTLSKNKNQLAMVDEDPGSAKTSYEKALIFKEESEGIKYFEDISGNKVLVLRGKLEDWMIGVCKRYHIKISAYGLPNNPDDLHDVINQKLPKFGELIDELIQNNNLALAKLKSYLN